MAKARGLHGAFGHDHIGIIGRVQTVTPALVGRGDSFVLLSYSLFSTLVS
ncbi:MAG: hypothetical protein ACYDGY_07140 [Acidimicrobiales bacterium]